MAPADLCFSPVLAVSKFPYKYMSSRISEPVAHGFFNRGQFFHRSWDLYYIWSPLFDTGKPIIVITLVQFQALIAEIDQKFPSLLVTIPSDAKNTGLILHFDSHPSLRPRFLGCSTSRDDFDTLSSRAEIFDTSSTDPPPSISEIKKFRSSMQAAIDAGKNKAAIKAIKAQERAAKQDGMRRQLKRAQQYLGLLPKTDSHVNLSTASLSSDSSALDVSSPAPFPFKEGIVFISVDVESYERNHSIITEIGISTLDTLDLQDTTPGPSGKNWHEFIRARHFRIKEYLHYKNSEYVRGCPDQFEFGLSEIVSKDDSQKAVAECFRDPFSKTEATRKTDDAPLRRIVLLGHDTEADVKYLREMGYDPTNLSNLLEIQDTRAMYQVYSKEINPRKLGDVLYECDIEAWNLHNAGNDAAYTMQAMLGICVKDLAPREESALGDMQQLKTALNEDVKVKEKGEETTEANGDLMSFDDDDADGGVALTPSRQSAAAPVKVETYVAASSPWGDVPPF